MSTFCRPPIAKNWKPTSLRLVLSILLLIPVWSVKYPPLQDYPNHLARAYIASRLTDPAYVFSQYYELVWQAVPNCLSDIILIVLELFVPTEVAGRILLSLILLGISMGFSLFLRTTGHRREGNVYAYLGYALAYSHFFQRGYLNYCLGLALMFTSLCCYTRWMESSRKFYWISAAVLSVLTYLAHIIPFAILVLSVGMMTVFAYKEKLEKVVSALSPLFPSLILLFLYLLENHPPLDVTWYPGLKSWMAALSQAFMTYAPMADLLLLFPLFVFWLFEFTRGLAKEECRNEWLYTSIALISLAWIMPRSTNILVRPGQRLLYPAFLIATAGFPPLSPKRRLILAVILTLTTALIIIRTEVTYLRMQRQLSYIASCIDKLELGTPVGHITSLPYEGSINPYIHFAEYAAIQKNASVSNLFTQYSLLKLRSPLPKTIDTQDLDPRMYPQAVIIGPSSKPSGYRLIAETPHCSVWRSLQLTHVGATRP